MDYITEIMDLVSERLASTASSEVVAGEPIKLGKFTIVPVSRVTLGIGAAGGSGEGQGKSAKSAGSKGTGGGTAGGARVRPMAVAVFCDEGVQILPIPDRRGHLDKLMDRIPAMIERFRKNDGDAGGDEEGQRAT